MTTAQFRRSTCHRQDRLLLRLTQAVPGCQAASRLILKPLAPLLARQPPIVGALGDTQVLEYLTLWKRGRSYVKGGVIIEMEQRVVRDLLGLGEDAVASVARLSDTTGQRWSAPCSRSRLPSRLSARRWRSYPPRPGSCPRRGGRWLPQFTSAFPLVVLLGTTASTIGAETVEAPYTAAERYLGCAPRPSLRPHPLRQARYCLAILNGPKSTVQEHLNFPCLLSPSNEGS